jgi:AcrR family transcriptional regulator
MAVTQTPRAKWIEEGLRALAEGGLDAVRVEALARRLGVTKGGCSWTFADRQALLEAMLDSWEEMVIDLIIEYVESEGGDGRQSQRGVIGVCSRGWGGVVNIEVTIRDWGRRDESVRKRLARIDKRRMEYMASLYQEFCSDPDEVETRCMVLGALWIGSAFMAADGRKAKRSEVLEMVMEWVLE